ncbi:hypothetical protein Droror1_Dr00026884 [Drosera rotundifolia]
MTTYENIRYRYDKKDNPYNIEFFGNLREILISRISPSRNDFHAIVTSNGSIPPGSMIPNLAVDISRKVKIDIEIGTGTDSDFSLPKILQDLDYDYVEDNLKNKESGEGRISGALFDDEEEPENPLKNITFDDVINLDRKIDISLAQNGENQRVLLKIGNLIGSLEKNLSIPCKWVGLGGNGTSF